MALYGIDISTWQSVGTSDRAKDFVICKATGADAGFYVDSKCDQHYQRAKAAGKLLGVYHFASPGVSTAEKQADFFVDNIQGYIGEAILVLDYETNTNVTWAKAFLDRVYERTGVRPLIYMSASAIAAADWSPVANADYGLWVAGYPSRYNVPNPPSPSDADMPYSIGPWGIWAIWQYSSSAGSLDLDIANMDREGWIKYAGANGSATPQPTPTPEPAPARYVEYTVQPGDTLSGIAAKFGTTYQKIAVDNGIADPNRIYPGQVFKIYTDGGSNEQYYTVQPGDTLSGIAAKFGTTYQKIAADNGIANPNLIHPGQRLVIK